MTGKDEEQATEQRIALACMLLDARLGSRSAHRGRIAQLDYETVLDFPPDREWILDMDKLYTYQQSAVKQWVAHMIGYLHDNQDQAPDAATLSLGRFSVSKNADEVSPVPAQLQYADGLLATSRLVKRQVKMS